MLYVRLITIDSVIQFRHCVFVLFVSVLFYVIRWFDVSKLC